MKILKSWAPYLAIILLVVLLRTFIITPVRVDGKSMNPTLENGQILLLEKINSNYKRFDIVVINYEENGQTEKLIKRIIGLPGEHISYRNNTLYVNNKKVEEPFSHFETPDFDIATLGSYNIPEDSYFVVGDNRINSNDSRYLGFMKKDQIIGKIVFSVFPHFGFM